MTDVHLIYTDHGDEFGWSLASPQIPGLTAGRDTVSELLSITEELLELAEAEVSGLGDPRVHLHEEHALVSPNGAEYLVRWQTGDGEDARTRTAARLEAGVRLGFDDDVLRRQPQLATTERLLIAVTGTDKVGWVTGQLGEGGCAVVSLSEGQDLDAVWSIPVADGTLGMDGVNSLEALGLTADSTVRELHDAVLAAEIQHLAEATKVPPADSAFHVGLI